MVPEYRICIIGSGAAGCLCAYFLSKNNIDITLFDKTLPLKTLLKTGGGRCNLAHAEYDFKVLAQNYPRGEKFLYSVFSKFATYETINVFNKIGVETYMQQDGRIFPTSNSAKKVREKILQNIKADIKIENVLKIEPYKNEYKVFTNKATYLFSHVIIAIGGHSGYELLKNFDIKIIAPKPSLVGLTTKNNVKNLAGTVIKNCECDGISGDILFTHFGISGPLTYKLSSLYAFNNFPYEINIDLYPTELDLQKMLNENPHKELKNVLSQIFPAKIVHYVLQNTDETQKACNINSKTRNDILNQIHNFKLTITGTNKGEETVTAGGIDLNEINSKTMEFKKYPNLYAIGEVLNIDGFCGGYNLQNAWSTAFVAAENIFALMCSG